MREVEAETARRFQQRLNYIRLMGNRTPVHVSRISLRDEVPIVADFDFSAGTIEALQRRGREAARKALDDPPAGERAASSPRVDDRRE
ncbi:hypothetical protein OKW30_008256 [Paraburkholderia sp. Clong3]|uniref:DUF3734 domain-containing protein n=1 Tax=Paraburkholderia sp. Clong3 TaxID=2991061 RepID=UPI003D261183